MSGLELSDVFPPWDVGTVNPQRITVWRDNEEDFWYALAEQIEHLQFLGCQNIFVETIKHWRDNTETRYWEHEATIRYYPLVRPIIDGVTYTIDKNGFSKEYSYV